MFDRLIRAALVIVGISVGCAWTWLGAFPDADPVAVLVRYHTPNVYRAVIAWYDVVLGLAVFLAGQLLISTSRIWFARIGVGLGLRARLSTWLLSPTADRPAIVSGVGYSPVTLTAGPAPDWRLISARDRYPGAVMFGAVGSGKTAACLPPSRANACAGRPTIPSGSGPSACVERCQAGAGSDGRLDTHATVKRVQPGA